MRGSECGCGINPHPMREGASSGRRAGDREARGAGGERREQDASRRARADRAVHRAVDPLRDEARHADGIDVARGRPDAAIGTIVAPETGAVLAAGDGGEIDGHRVHARIGRNAAAEMVVMPSHYESFGMVALEAMAMGTPVIASEVGGLAHLVQPGVNGFHVPSRDPEALAARILALLTNKPLRQQLGEQARAHTKQYSWESIAARMIEVYQEVATPQPLLPMA